MLTLIYKTVIWILLIYGILACDEGNKAVKVATDCVQSDLIAQCPPGTTADLSASATSMCAAAADAELNLLSESGSVTASCGGSGECRVVCRFETPCECGVDRITEEGVFCVDDCASTACGNGVCEIGEDSNSCPIDCAATCQSGDERCNGKNRQICADSNVWEELDCAEGTACQEVESNMTICIESQVCGNQICEMGEDFNTCPMDCASTCQAGHERCNGQHRQICSATGVWEELRCVDNTTCQEGMQNTTLCVDDRVCGNQVCEIGEDISNCPMDCDCVETIWYADADMDGFGNVEQIVSACQAPDNYVANHGDCNDANPQIHVNAAEVCDDSIDNNCNQQIDCADSVCSDSSHCVEQNCADALDNDGDELIDCADHDCFNHPTCSSECLTYCQDFAMICAAPGYSEITCREACGHFESEMGNHPIYQSNTLDCRSLYLESAASNNQAIYCERSRPNNNEYCQNQANDDCYTYCAMMNRYCPATFNTVSQCQSACRDFAADSLDDLDNGPLYPEALSCRLENLENVATVNGLECNNAGAGPMGCPGVYRTEIGPDDNRVINFELAELSVGLNSLVYWSNQDINRGYYFQLRSIPSRGGAQTVHTFNLESRRFPLHWTNYTFDQIGTYTALIYTGPGRDADLVSSMQIIVE